MTRRELDDAAALLIQLNGFKQRLEIPFTKAVVAFAVNNFEKDRANGILGEYLQQDPAAVIAVDENPAPL